MKRTAHRFALVVLSCLSLSLAACSSESADNADANDTPADTSTSSTGKNEPRGVIARVGDQTISFHEINTMINSAAIVGLSMPELGSPERDTVRITLLDRLISANLLYLDALKQGVDQDPVYQKDMQVFEDSILASLYRSKVLVGDIEVTDQEVEDFYQSSIIEGTEFTDELRAGIEATIRKQRLKERTSTMRERLREGYKVEINVTEIDPEGDQVRFDREVVATLDGTPITWAEVKPAMLRAHTMKSTQQRIEALEKIIDARIMAQLGRKAGLEEDPVYLSRVGEFSKTRLINLHRGNLLAAWEPTDEDLNAYYEANKDRIIVKEMRKVQMLVVKSREEAEELKQKINAGEITFHKAVAEYSILPDSKKTLGQIGWVSEDTGFPELSEVTFFLEAGEIGGPVESPTGWHLVRVLDQRDALHKNITDEQTRKVVRKMYLDDRLNQYVVDLRKTGGIVVDIDDDMINTLSQQEIDWYQQMLEKAQKSPEEVIEEIEKLRK